MKSCIWYVFLILPFLVRGQDTYLRFAFTGDIGTKFRKAGLLFQISQESGKKDRYEFHSGVQLKFVQLGYGPQKNSTELSFHLGTAVGLGIWTGNGLDSGNVPFSFLRSSGRKSKIAYTYNFYIDKHDTSQGTGTITLKFGQVYVISENDIFGNLNGLDRYRTGSLGLYYQKNNFFGGIKTTLWTGETRCQRMQRIKDKKFPGRYGYKDIQQCKYANLSHGLLSLEAGYIHNNVFMPAIRFGRDDERIRNIVQNEIIHDMDFIPNKWNTAQNLHIPMIDIEGKPYLYRKDQKIKKGNYFFQIAVNNSRFY